MKNHGEWYTLGGTILFVIIVSIVGFIDWHGENKDYSKEYRRIENLIEQWIHNIGYDINSGRILEYIDAENLAVFLALAEEMYKDQIAISSKYLEKIEEIKRIRQDRSSYTILDIPDAPEDISNEARYRYWDYMTKHIRDDKDDSIECFVNVAERIFKEYNIDY